MSTVQLIRQVRLVDGVTHTDQIGDVRVEAGRIAAIGAVLDDYPPHTEIIEGQGKILVPGLVDLYSYSGEPGHESRETLASLLAAAAAGGITRLGILPSTLPAIDHVAMVESLINHRQVLAIARHGATIPHIYPWGALTAGAQGEQMAALDDLATAPIVGFADDQPISNLLLVQRLLEYLQPFDKPLALWPCDRRLQAGGVARQGAFALIYGLVGDPPTSETTALAALLECVALTGTPVHLMRITTARGVELVTQAKTQGLPVTASTPWMHLVFSTRDLASYDPTLRLDPPLGNPEDRSALISGLKTGVIDAISIDHRPYTYEEKTVSFATAPPGAIGLELAWPILWQRLVVNGDWSALDLVQALSTRPARCWQQSPPSLQPGQPAEMVLFDPARTWTVGAQSLQSLALNSPYLGQTVRGQVVRSWVPVNRP
ncbi:MAG: dihydroorotase [Nodosilinea sp.]